MTDVDGERDLVVAAKRPAADGVVTLTLTDPAGADLPGWDPGAHIDLILGADLVRQYSLCGDPADRGGWTVAVLREPDSRGGSRHVHDQLAEGDRVGVRGPRNNFPLVTSKRYLFIAGGVGITPIVPMVAAARAAGADWRLVYGGRTRASMAFRSELAGHGDCVTLCPQDTSGLLDLDGLLGRPEPDTLVYCCGPEPLLLAVEQRCAAWPPGALRVERFSPKAIPDGAPQEAFEVELARSGMTLLVPPGRSILEVVEDAGVEVLFSCQEGTCGTCETAVLDGSPDHRDSLLTDDERAADDTMFICVSRSRTPKLVLDL